MEIHCLKAPERKARLTVREEVSKWPHSSKTAKSHFSVKFGSELFVRATNGSRTVALLRLEAHQAAIIAFWHLSTSAGSIWNFWRAQKVSGPTWRGQNQ